MSEATFQSHLGETVVKSQIKLRVIRSGMNFRRTANHQKAFMPPVGTAIGVGIDSALG